MTLAEALRPRLSLWGRMVERNGRRRVVLTLGLLAAIIAIGLAAPFLPLQDPLKPIPLVKLAPPSWEHLFGTDQNGMDVFSRTIFAIRTDFALALSSVILGTLVGVPLGAVSGYFGGWIDAVLTRLAEVIQGFPQILFGMAFIAATGNSLTNVVVVVAFYNVPVYAKMVRSVVVPLREIDYVQAARVAGQRSATGGLPPHRTERADAGVRPAPALLRLRRADDRGPLVHRPRRADPDAGMGIDDPGRRQLHGVRQMVAFGLSRAGAFSVGLAAQRLVGHPAVALGPAGVSALLNIRDLAIRFRQGSEMVEALAGVSFSVGPGERVAVVGESGSGKTLCSIAAIGLLPLNAEVASGAIRFADEDVTRAPEARMRQLRGRRMAMVFQNAPHSLNPLLTVGRQIADVHRRHHGGGRTAAWAQAVAVLGGDRHPGRGHTCPALSA